MGILDDAIREHLDLKRKRGAGSRELERLEQEAFGPPSRPGELEPSTEGAEGDRDGEDLAASTLQPLEKPTALERESLEQREPEDEIGSWQEDPGDDDGISATEKARIEHPDLGDTAAHPAPGLDLEEEGGAPEAAPGAEAIEAERAEAEAPEAEIFDPAEEFGELELELEEDEDDDEDEAALGDRLPEAEAPAEQAGPAAEQAGPAAEQAGPGTDQRSGPETEGFELPEEDFELDLPEDAALEHEILPDRREEAATEPASEQPIEGQPASDEPIEGYVEDDDDLLPEPVDELGEEEAADDEDDEDLLEETPEFLKDAPEGDRLWFEQGSPQDFDFDD